MTFHEKILKELLKYKENHPDFRFIPRQINRSGRLDNGYWFQGTDDYAFVGLVDRSGGSNMTRSVGLVFWPVDDYLEFSIEIVHKGEKDKYILSLYDKLKETLKGFIQKEPEKNYKYLGDTSNGFDEVFKFLDENYLNVINVFKNSERPDLVINEKKYSQLISRINSYRKDINYTLNKLLINLTWNSKDWKEESEDNSNHRWVKDGGIPGESLNFAKDAEGNTNEHIFGYAKFTHEPKIKGSSIFVFYSQDKIVGFYGNAELTHKELEDNIVLNLKGDQNLSFVLENKIDNAKELGFLEDKERVGMINFNYVEHDKTIIGILNKALELNPNQEGEILTLKKWFVEKTNYKDDELGYWIFQGNPKIYDAVNALQNNAIKTWTVTSHKDKIKKGDKFILWLTGSNAGCYALGRVDSAVTMMKEEKEEMSYYITPTPQIENTRVKIVIEKNLSNSPILWESIKDQEVFKEFKAGNQGTNFTATKAEFDYFNTMDKHNLDTFINYYIQVCQKTDWLDNEIYKFEWAKWVHDKANFDTTDDALLFQLAIDSHKVTYTGSIGVQFIKQGAREQMSKYIGIDDIRYFREFKEGKTLTEIGFEDRNMSFPIVSCWLSVFFPEKIYPVSRTSFADVVRKLFNAKVSNSNIAFIESLQHYCLQIDTKLKEKTDYQIILKDKLQLSELSQLEYNWAVQDFLLYLDRNPELFTAETTSTTQTNDTMSATNLNQILFGPPGTGKTFKLQQIINEWDLQEKTGIEKDYSSFVKKYTWWKIIALALLESNNIIVPELAKHPLIIAKLGSSNVKQLNTRLWSSLQHHCVDDCENVKLAKRIGERVFYKEKTSAWRLADRERFEEEYISLIEDYKEFKNSSETKSKDYTFTTCHQSLSYEDFIEGIKPDLNLFEEVEDEENKSKSLVYEIRKGIFYNACEKAAQKAGFINLKDCLDSKKEKRKILFNKAIQENKIHVIFLDEINRCNVSAVFGELITLIEEDKRLGNENEISDIVLPYSQEEFGVPANLFIIGTMNTADRSVEALDTALRRRFCFKEMMPDSSIVEKRAFKDYPRKEIMERINNRVEVLLDKNHTLGHSYFIKDNFEHSFKNEIIPLLQEYFYNDAGKLGLILGKGFVRSKEMTSNASKSIFADFETKNEIDIVKSYELIPFEALDFKVAINTLLA